MVSIVKIKLTQPDELELGLSLAINKQKKHFFYFACGICSKYRCGGGGGVWLVM